MMSRLSNDWICCLRSPKSFFLKVHWFPQVVIKHYIRHFEILFSLVFQFYMVVKKEKTTSCVCCNFSAWNVSLALRTWILLPREGTIKVPLRFKHRCVPAKLPQSCLILYDPKDCSPPGSSVCEILQARMLEWVAIPSSRGFSWPRDWTCVS